jgi:hypothetical protein
MWAAIPIGDSRYQGMGPSDGGHSLMKKAGAIAIAAGLGLGGLAGAFALFAWPMLNNVRTVAAPSHPVWAEVQWPHAMDEWGKGKAFRCGTADCGADIELYIRAKIGFCNCKTGVSDDEELHRLSDVRLTGERSSVLGPGHPISVAWMKGRSRAYVVADPYRARNSALTIAFNDRCDAIVATVMVPHDHPEAIEPSVIDFLNSKTILDWAETTLGL